MKFKLAMTFIASILLSSSLLAGTPIKDEDQWNHQGQDLSNPKPIQDEFNSQFGEAGQDQCGELGQDQYDNQYRKNFESGRCNYDSYNHNYYRRNSHFDEGYSCEAIARSFLGNTRFLPEGEFEFKNGYYCGRKYDKIEIEIEDDGEIECDIDFD